jgi:large subunit ribosomal protein L21
MRWHSAHDRNEEHMAIAVFATGGRQYRVQPGDVVRLERLSTDAGSITFDRVLLVEDGSDVRVGTPTVDGVTVDATVLGELKGTKLRVSTYRAKKRTRRTIGHRQRYTQIRIDAIRDSSRQGADAGEPAKDSAMSAAKAGASKAKSAAKPKAKAAAAKPKAAAKSGSASKAPAAKGKAAAKPKAKGGK